MGPWDQAREEIVATPRRRATPGVLLGQPDPVPAPTPPAADAAAPRDAAQLDLETIDWDALAPRGPYARGGQRALCLLLLVLALPIALALALPVALANLLYFRDPRRILFVQERVGRRGRRFRILKFRTMSEPRRSSFESWSSHEDAARVTPLGRFLRNAHLDELPQLWNVLRGDMSLFGPRPEMVEVDAWARENVPGFHRRLAVAPGLTGLSQVTQGYAGRDPEAYRTKLEGDLVYLARFGLRQDLALILRTLAWVVRGRGWRWNG